MTYPAQYPAQPQYPAQQFPAQPQFPAQYPAQPQYPVQQQQFAAPAYPPAAPAAPQQPLVQGSLDDFFQQPSAGGGKSLTFPDKAYGTAYVGIVSRPVSQGDIQQQTDVHGRPQFFKDGRPKFVMKVPLQLQPSPAYPDGLATWFVKGAARDELVRAMAEVGAPAGAPEAGAIIQVTYTGDRASGAGMNPAKLFQVTYRRPDGAAPVSQVPEPTAPAVAPVPTLPAVPVAQPVAQAPAAAPQYAPPAAPAQPVAPAPQAPVPAAPQPPAELSADQQALLAKLTGQQV